MLSPFKYSAVGIAIGLGVAFLFARWAGEYTLSFGDWEFRNVDETLALVSGGVVGGLVGLLWGWRRLS